MGSLNLEILSVQLRTWAVGNYGSIKAFCEKTGFPISTANNILRRTREPSWGTMSKLKDLGFVFDATEVRDRPAKYAIKTTTTAKKIDSQASCLSRTIVHDDDAEENYELNNRWMESRGILNREISVLESVESIEDLGISYVDTLIILHDEQFSNGGIYAFVKEDLIVSKIRFKKGKWIAVSRDKQIEVDDDCFLLGKVVALIRDI